MMVKKTKSVNKSHKNAINGSKQINNPDIAEKQHTPAKYSFSRLNRKSVLHHDFKNLQLKMSIAS